MKLIVGLGNPGSQYEKTRHNAGFMVLDRLAARHAAGQVPKARFHGATVEARLGTKRCVLIKPTTYMNRSGRCVGEAVRFYKSDPASDLLVLVDDTALPVGRIRLRASGSPGGHNGLTDISRALGGDEYPRCRIGIGAKPPVMVLSDYVLSRFTEEEFAALDPALDRAASACEVFAAEGITASMNQFNTKEPEASDPPMHPGWAAGDSGQDTRGRNE